MHSHSTTRQGYHLWGAILPRGLSLFWRNKMNWNIMGAHQIKSARTLFDMRPLMGTTWRQ